MKKENIKNGNKKLIQNFDNSDNDISKKSDTMISQSHDEIDIQINDNTCNEVITEFTKIKGCSILKYGIKMSTEKIKYGYCQTCDVNLMHPICLECVNLCHRAIAHKVREIREPGYIRCGCGSKMHKILNIKRNSKLLISRECPYSDWCEKSRLSTLYVIDGKCVCEFCYRICGYEGKGKPLEKEKEMLQVCECEELNGAITHTDLKKLYKKFEDLLMSKSNLIFGLNPIQFFNLLFLGKSSYDSIFLNFEEMIQSFYKLNSDNLLNLKENFTSTNFYLSLMVFCKIIEKSKSSSLRYYAPEIVNKFSFELISNLLNNIIFQDNQIFWKFICSMVFLYRKINIGYNTMNMGKLKLNDLENLSPLIRKSLMINNKVLFPDCSKQITFFINFLNNLLKNEIRLVDAYDVFIQVCQILKKLSGFYLFDNVNMTMFCFSFEEMFEFFKKQTSYVKQIELFHIIIKMFSYFIYCYNDNYFYDFITDKKKEDEDLSKVQFAFYKNQLGCLISRHVIRILYYIITVIKFNQLLKGDRNKCSNILNLGTKILYLLLGEKDSYFISNIKGYKQNDGLLKLLLIPENDERIRNLSDQINSIGNIYLKYYTFDADNRDIIREVNNSLDRVINMSKNNEMRLYISKTNYFYILCKIFYIIKYNEEDEEQEDKDALKKLITNIFMFLQYFVEGNEHNALLIYSQYILYALLKLPDDYLVDIFKLYTKCTDIILKNKGIICNPMLIVETLFNYLINYKDNSKGKWNKESTDFFIDDVKVIDQIIFLFLNIIIKIFLQMKLIYPVLCLKSIKPILIKFMENFEFISLINYNACLLLILINKIFDSSSQVEREQIIKFIPIQKLINTLKDTNILIDLRTEILIFIEKYHASLCFSQNEILKKNFSNDISSSYMGSGLYKSIESPSKNKMNINSNIKKKKKKVVRTKIKKKYNSVNKNIVKVKINNLFGLNNEEPLRNNYYLNAIGQDLDLFYNIKNSTLITNYQFPTKYLSFNYYLEKNQENNDSKLNEILELFENEIKRFKDIYEKNLDNVNKILKYYIKGIIIPICPIIKRYFCKTFFCDGHTILKIYEIITKMMFIKNLIMENNNILVGERKQIEFENFDLATYLDKNNADEALNDYFNLKERRHSPYDFTHIWEIFDKHFLNYIKYPESINLEELFPLTEIDYLIYGKLSEEIDIFDEINLNLKKKTGNSIIKKNMTKGNKNFLLINGNKNKNKSFIKNSTFQYNMSISQSNIDLNEDNEGQKQKLHNKITKIFEFYCTEKNKINVNNSSLLISLPELCAEYEVNYRKMILCILFNLSSEGIEYDLISKIMFYKILLLSTAETQSDIIDIIGGKDVKESGFLINLCNSMYYNLIKFFLDDFNFDFLRYKSTQINIFCIARILKLLCEEHNNFFQEKLSCSINYYFYRLEECVMNFTAKSKFFNSNDKNGENLNNSMIEESMSFFNFMVNSLHKFILITNRAQNYDHTGCIYDLFYSIIELLVEIIQGNKKELLSKVKTDNSNNMTLFTFKNFISLDAEVLFNDSLISGPGFRIRLLLISFFIALFEEKTNKELQKIIMKFLTLNNVLDSINFTMKNYFYEKTKDNQKYKNYYSDYSGKQIEQREFIFDNIIYSFFKYHYFHSDVSKISKEFKLANNYYKYIKKISISEKSVEAKDLIKKVEKLSESEAKKNFALFNKKIIKNNDIAPINLTNEKEKSISISYIEHYYIIKFFESITKVVEIRLPQEYRNVNVIFTVPCEMIHLTEMTKKEFVHNVDRTNENSKKCELVRNLPLFQLEIEYFKNIKVNCIQKLILNIDFIYIQYFMYIYAVIFLIIMLFTLEGYKKIEPIIESGEERRRRLLENNMRKLIEIPSHISNAIDESISKYGLYYDFINYGFVILNGLFIFSWVAVKLPLYYIFDKFQYMEENKIQKEENLTIINKIYISIFWTMIGRDYINSLLYMFLISLIGAIMKRGEIVYAFFLLAIIDLNPTLKGIAISIKSKGPELLASFLFLVFIVHFYTNVGFFFLNDNFEADIEDDIPDNYCLCLSFCFLTNFDAGIRARGGAGDQMVRISFERHTSLYIYRLLYDITYFLICIIIMIDLIFGIILGTFTEKREEERKHDNDKINHCFICHITREIIEKKREDFQVHRNQKHYLWNYVEYMIYLNFSDMHELNAFNSFSKINLDKKNICFLPSCQDDFEKDEGTIQEIIEEKENEEPLENSEDSSDYENTDRIDLNLIEES